MGGHSNTLSLLSGCATGAGVLLGTLYALSLLAHRMPDKFGRRPALSPPDPQLDRVASALTAPKPQRPRPRPAKPATRPVPGSRGSHRQR